MVGGKNFNSRFQTPGNLASGVSATADVPAHLVLRGRIHLDASREMDLSIERVLWGAWGAGAYYQLKRMITKLGVQEYIF